MVLWHHTITYFQEFKKEIFGFKLHQTELAISERGKWKDYLKSQR